MTDKTDVVLFNTYDSLTTSDGKEKEHIWSDALVIHKNGLNCLLTIHGDVSIPEETNIDGNISTISGYRAEHCTTGMYKINALEAKILSSLPPSSIIFKATLNKIKKRQNLKYVDLGKKGSETADKMRSDIMTKDKELALSKQVEYGAQWKQKYDAKEKAKQEKIQESQKVASAKMTKFLDKFTHVK